MTRMTAIKFEAVPEFPNELETLSKKYRWLKEDFEKFKKVLTKIPFKFLPGNHRISDLGINVKTPIYKVKHFRSRDFKGKGSRSGFRIIYAYVKDDKEDKIIFIEIYHKNNKNNHNKERIKKYFEDI